MNGTKPLKRTLLSEIGVEESAVKSTSSIWKKAHCRAAINWLSKYEAPSDSSNLQKVYRCLEAFHHFSVVQEWTIASNIVSFPLDFLLGDSLHEQLYNWGYYHQQIKIYALLLDKLAYDWSIICLSGLGKAFDALGDEEQAVMYYQQWRELAKKNGDSQQEALAICSMGIDLGQQSSGAIIITAFELLKPNDAKDSRRRRAHSQSLTNWLTKYHPATLETGELLKGVLEAWYHCCENGDWKGAAQMLELPLKPDRHNKLSDHLFIAGHNSQIIEMYGRLTQKLGARWDGICHVKIGRSYNSVGELKQAIEHLESSIDIFQYLGESPREGFALQQLGISYRILESTKAIDFHQKSFSIAQDIGNRISQATSLGELGITYALFGEDDLAIDCLRHSLVLSQDKNRKAEQTIPLNGLAYFYLQQGDLSKAIEYGRIQLALSREIGYFNSISNALCILGEADYKMDDYSAAHDKLEEALTISLKTQYRLGEFNAKKCLMKLHAKQDQQELFVKYYDELFVLRVLLKDLVLTRQNG